MEFIVPAIIVLFVIIRTIMSASKGNQRNRASSNQARSVFGSVSDAIQRTIDQQSTQSRFQNSQSNQGQRRGQPSPPPLPSNRPVSYTRDLDISDSNHFSEERMVAEYKRAHAQGKTIEHHTHDYFDPETDQNKSRAGEAKKKRNINRKALLRTENIKRAIIMKEILDRPDF